MQTRPRTQPPRQRAVRQDSLRNQQALVDAVGELLREDPESATMAAVAERAGVSIATAYRYHPTLDSLHRTFMLSVVWRLDDATRNLNSKGVERFQQILEEWLPIVSDYGEAMVLIRSREGFLSRYLNGEPHAVALDRIWGDAIKQMLEAQGIDSDQYPFALSLYNSLVNSREILDLMEATKASHQAIASHLRSVFQASLEGLKDPSIRPQAQPES